MKKRKFVWYVLIMSSIATVSQAQTSSRKFIDRANMDESVSPRENFYQYANGGWLKNNPIPLTETRWGSFNELISNTNQILKGILKEAADKNATYGSNSQLVGDFFASGMDSLEIESAGVSPTNSLFSDIKSINTTKDLLNEITSLHKSGIDAAFNFVIYQDDKQSSQVIAQLSQGGLGLPDRDYYFNMDDRSSNIRTEYQKHLVNMFKIFGDDKKTANKNAEAVIKLETALAGASMTRVEQRNPNKIYHKLSLAELQKITPLIFWKETLNDFTGQDIKEVLVRQPEFFKEFDRQLVATPLNEWKAYLKWNVIRAAAPYLHSIAVNENFNFYGKVLTGQKNLKPRADRVSVVVDNSMGEVLGRMYVSRYFKPEAKTRMLELIKNLTVTYEDRIKRLDWMSDETKQKALTKLHAFIRKIGYPDVWKDYSSVHISRTSYFGNVLECNKYDYNFMLDKLGKPVDKAEWGMSAPTINAYYNPVVNEIVFPAGILQSPFFDFNADDAVNYGGIGCAIGHEMTHGFDDQGRQYDAEGNLNDWWTKNDADRFKERAYKVVEQYNSYTVLNGTMNVNGQLTLGENLADFGGINIAFEAFKKTPQAMKGEMIDGFTPEQRFFLSWAQIWRANIRDEAQAQRIVTDPHSPGMYRCNGPVSNMPEFYEAFNVRQGDPMWRKPAERAVIW
ncbi:M13 family metallopeptidase [Solitalea sp. MAHUQ-68]|uniref:M13 family metallopeptidase n=1 Tax=Solitalea agri TaxID=2953739 RepID=A0A9X2F5F9_9SPHI|nr:M13 family metallopeptidase [Solitalea agri]MCO4294585.1 M13 family metallopeptidase [Solitalea agri]